MIHAKIPNYGSNFQKFHTIFRFSMKKCIKMSTNKPSIGTMLPGITPCIKKMNKKQTNKQEIDLICCCSGIMYTNILSGSLWVLVHPQTLNMS